MSTYWPFQIRSHVSNGIGGAFGLMSTGSFSVASIAKMGVVTVVAVGFNNDMDEWLIACTGTVNEFGANNAMFASEHAGGMAPTPG